MALRPAAVRFVEEGPVSCAAVLWKRDATLHLTVVVKATFSIVPGGVATLCPPDPVVVDDRHEGGDPARPVEAPSELAPWLPRAEVLLRGTAYAAARLPTTRTRVRLALSREGARVLDKELFVYADGAPFRQIGVGYDRALTGPDNPNGRAAPGVLDPTHPDATAGFGPFGRATPRRAAALAWIANIDVPGAILYVPRTAHGQCFQSAPADQCIDALEGNETFQIDGMHPDLARIECRLPAARATMTVEGGPSPAIALRADTLRIDSDRMRCWLLWRGPLRLADEAAASSLTLRATLTLGSPGTASPVGVAQRTGGGGTLDLGKVAHGATRPIATAAFAARDTGAVRAASRARQDTIPTTTDDEPPPTQVLPETSLRVTSIPFDEPSVDMPFDPGATGARQVRAGGGAAPAAPIAGAPWSPIAAAPAPPAKAVVSTTELDPDAIANAMAAAMPAATPGLPPAGALDERERSLEEYVAIRIALEASTNRADALQQRRVDLAEWARLDRYWRRRAQADPEIARELRERLPKRR